MRRATLLVAAAAAALLTLLTMAGGASPGKQVFEKRCTGCHALDRDKEGPRLRGVYGRTSASVPSFEYSEALRKARITWESASLDKWLTSPDGLVPGTDMGFHLAKADERAAVISYLKEISVR